MKKLFLFIAALFTATVMNLNAADVDMDTLYLNTGGNTLWNQAGAKFSVWYWNDGEAGEFTDFLELAYGETDIYRAIIPASDSVIFVRHAATADVPTWDNKLHYTKGEKVNLEDNGNIMVVNGWEPADLEWDNYTPKQAPDMHDFLHFVSLKDNGTVKLNKTAWDEEYLPALTATFEYSTDRKTWTEYTWGGTDKNIGAAIALPNAGDTVFFRAKGTNGKNATISDNGDDTAFFQFVFGENDSIAAGGNVMSLYDASCEQTTMTHDGLVFLFYDAKQLVSAPKLSATTLANHCYMDMFLNCTALTTAPALPATTLTKSCYWGMFSGCIALTQAPELKAETLANDCYSDMFENCTALTQAPELPATKLAESCYYHMFENCTALTQAPELKATTLAPTCYLKMFYNCTSLEINAFSESCDGAELVVPTTGATNWNQNMFAGCKGDAALTAQNGIQLGGHYCIKEYAPACKIGDKEYASIAAAVAEVKAGDTIQVLKDIQLDARISVASATPAFTLDLNGHILDGSTITGTHKSLIYSEGTLSIIDSNPTATHAAPFDTIAGAIMTGGKGCKSNDNNTYGGAIDCTNGTLNVDGVTFVNNSAYRGGAAWVNNTNSTFTNCRFYGNTCTSQGAALGFTANSQCNIDSCVFKGNSTKTGTIYAIDCSLTIAHTTITDNAGTLQGGGMFMQAVNLTLGDGLVVTNNTSKSDWQSGGIYIWTEPGDINTVTMSGKIIVKDNTTNGKPANLCLSGIPTCDTLALNGLSEGSEIYVCTMINDAVAPATFVANATEADLQYFKSDNGYAFILKEGMIVSKEAYGRKVTNGNFGTICLDKQFIATEGVEVLYVPSYKDASKLYCVEVDLDDVVAGGAYIFKSNADSVTFAFEGEAVSAPVNNDHMIGWLAADFVLTGETDSYMLYNNQIMKPEVGSTILKNRAFIDLDNVPTSKPAAVPNRRMISFGINAANTPTGVVEMQNAQCTMQNGKVMMNGQLIIIRDGKMFNAQGQEL